MSRALDTLSLPEPVFRTCPWQPRELIVTGLFQWLRCCALSIRRGPRIGMPSRAVDEAWHGFILCTALYSEFCSAAYGRYLHHHPEGAAPDTEPMAQQLHRTILTWPEVARPGEQCVLWDLDHHVGVPQPWGLDLAHVATTQVGTRLLVRRRRRSPYGDLMKSPTPSQPPP